VQHRFQKMMHLVRRIGVIAADEYVVVGFYALEHAGHDVALASYRF
jgi:hypothetical protein